MQKVHTALLENNYQTAKQLAKHCNFQPCSIYRIVRMLRLQGIGVIPKKKGYVLSEFALKTDDVGFIRRCYGRRVSDFISIHAALKHINGRWKTLQDKSAMQQMLLPLSSNLMTSKGMKILLTQSSLLSSK